MSTRGTVVVAVALLAALPSWKRVLMANDPQNFREAERGAGADHPGRQRRADSRGLDTDPHDRISATSGRTSNAGFTQVRVIRA
jgi:hypothetical protein